MSLQPQPNMGQKGMPKDYTDLNAIKTKLAPLYRPNRVWSYAEEVGLLQILRNPTWQEDTDAVLAYHAGMTPHERRFFPNSMLRLLSDFDEVLDRIHVANQAKGTPKATGTADKILWAQEIKRVEARLKVLKTILDGDGLESPTKEHREESVRLRARRHELIKLLAFSV